MTPEGRVKEEVRKILDSHTPVFRYSPVSTGYGQHGIPDFVCCVNGYFVVIECKAGKNKLTSLQQLMQDTIHRAKGVWLTVNEQNVRDVELRLLHLGAVPFDTIK